jgi:hypothetical protein
MTLILLVLSVLAHLHKPGHSPKYLLALLILCLPTLMVALLAFLVDILIFLPHVQWGGWIVLAATILIVISGVVMCGMRRQIVGRIARSKRIQENAEMNGQPYFSRSQQAPPPDGTQDKVPEFSAFEVNKVVSAGEGERIPLNPRARTASPPTAEDQGFTRTSTFNSDRSYGSPPPRGNGPLGPGPNPMGGSGAMAPAMYSNQTLSSSGSSGTYGPPPGRGPGSDGGYGAPPRPYDGVSGVPMNRYGPRPPPGGFRGGPIGPGGFDPRRVPNQGYGPSPSNTYGPPFRVQNPPGAPPVPVMGSRVPPGRRYVPPPGRTYEEPEYPAGIDNARSDEKREFEQSLTPAPTNIEMIGRAVSDEGVVEDGDTPHELPAPHSNAGSGAGSSTGRLAVVNETPNVYDEDAPHARWQQDGHRTTGSPDQHYPTAELPASRSDSVKSKRKSGTYYEDVAPQFDPSHDPPAPSASPTLVPGTTGLPHPGGPWSPPPVPDDAVIEDGQRSPTTSTASGFTSISQRGINPRWQEEQSRMGGPGRGRVPSVGLAGNPDFELPAIAGARRGGRNVRGGPAGFR